MRGGRREFLRTTAGVGLAAMLPEIGGAKNSNVRDRYEGGKLSTGAVMPQDHAALRAQFPALAQKVNGHDLVFLDSAATTQRPLAVINAISDFYRMDNANPSATMHTLARKSAAIYADARQSVGRFLNAKAPEEIVWTHGTTEAINLVASSWGGANLRAGDEIILTVAEHYSNLVPWQLLAQRTGARIQFLDITNDGHLKLDLLEKLLSRRTKLVAFSHVSNVLGLVNPAKEICDMAHRAGAMVLIDGAQSAPHVPIDVQAMGCDFFACSGHKIMGPMGTGILWARREILDAMPPYQSGSIMTHEVDIAAAPTHFAEGGLKFSAGSPDVCGAVGIAAAIKFTESLGNKILMEHNRELTQHALARLGEVKGLKILGPKSAENRISVFTFALEGRKAMDVVAELDAEGIAVRGGDMAALPLLKRLGVNEAVRASCYHYTTTEEIDRLVSVLQRNRAAN
jgi:cysteine desulfurase/selenocysteine lyase